MNGKSTISIALCTFNGEAYIQQQLDSLASQTLTPNELVVCDDGSTDSTVSVLEVFASQAPMPVRLYLNSERLGPVQNFEKAITLCSGDIIALCDQDDVWQPNKLQRFDDIFSEAAEAGMVFTNGEIVDSNLNPSGTTLWQMRRFDKKTREALARGRFDLIAPGWTVTGATMAFRSKYRKLCLPVPVELSMLHDAWIAVTIASVSRVVPLAEPLIKYRRHEKQHTGIQSAQADSSSGHLKRIGRSLQEPYSPSELSRSLLTLQARLRLHEGSFDVTEALKVIQSYLQHLETRAGLQSGKLARIPTIIRELTSRRYHHYSNGFLSAAKDLVSLRTHSSKM